MAGRATLDLFSWGSTLRRDQTLRGAAGWLERALAAAVVSAPPAQ
jgi:hypothetical protein